MFVSPQIGECFFLPGAWIEGVYLFDMELENQSHYCITCKFCCIKYLVTKDQ